MGRSIIADDSVEKYINKLLKENKWFVGVIIGQLTSQRDYVVHIARTPDPAEDEVSEENGEDEPSEGVKVKKPTVVRPASLDQLDEKWVSTHAKQVSRMLPGGLNIVGIFALAPPAMLKNSQTKLRQMLFNIHKQLNKNAVFTSPDEITDRILLQMDTTTKKLTCLTVDVADVKSSLRPAEWKFQSGGSKWVRLTSHVNIDIPMAVPEGGKSQALLKQIQNGLVDFCEIVRKSIITVGGAIKDPSEPLISTAEKKGKGGKGSKTDVTSSSSQSVSIFLPYTSKEERNDAQINTSQATINMTGTTVVRAFVSAKATVSDALEAVRMDVIRSLFARCELLCEEFDVTEGKQGSEVYDPPVRLFCRLPGCDVEVCDYVFQDEKQEEVKQRIKELMDVEVGDLEEPEKSAADDDTWSRQSSISCMSSHQSLASGPQPEKKSVVKTYVGAAVGGIVALAATWLSYMYIGDE